MTQFMTPPNIDGSGVRAFFTSKIAGSASDAADTVYRELGIRSLEIYMPVQRHTDSVIVLESENHPEVGDAVVTNRRGLLIGVLVADCVPVLLSDTHRRIIGAVHAGWKGTASGIVKNTIRTMRERFDSAPEDMHVAIGPSIRQCSYEVGRAVRDAVVGGTGEGDYYQAAGDKYFVDLASANMIQAVEAGVSRDRIWCSGECTYCNPAKYYSYRYRNGYEGRQGGFIGMW